MIREAEADYAAVKKSASCMYRQNAAIVFFYRFTVLQYRKQILRLAMKNEIVTIGAFAALTFIEPYAAVGALGGVCFFLSHAQQLRVVAAHAADRVVWPYGLCAGVSDWGTNNMMLNV